MTITIVDDDRHGGQAARAAVPASRRGRCACAGTARRGRRARPGGRLPRAREPAPRRPRGDAQARRCGSTLTAPRPTVLAGGPDGTAGSRGPWRAPVPFRVRVVSRRHPTRMRVLRTDAGEPREVARFSACRRASARASGTAAPTARRRRPAPTRSSRAVRDRAGNVGRSAPEGRGIVRGEPGVSVRALLVRRRPIRCARARTSIRRRLARPAVPLADSRVGGVELSRAERRRIAARGPPRGRRRTGGELSSARRAATPALYVLDVRAGDATRPPRRSPSRASSPRRSSSCSPRSPGSARDTLDDDRDGVPNTLDNGCPGRLPAAARGGLPAGLRRPTSRALLGFLDGQGVALRRDDRPDARRVAPRADAASAQGVLLAGPHALGPDRAGAPAAPLRRRRRPRRVVRRRLAAARRRRRPRPAAAPAAAAPTATRSAPGCAPLRRLEHAAAARSPSPTRATRDCSPASSSCPASRGSRSPSRPSACAWRWPRSTDAAIEEAEAAGEPLPDADPALTLTQLGEGIVIRVGLPEWGAQLQAGAPSGAAAHPQHRRHPARREPRIRSF